MFRRDGSFVRTLDLPGRYGSIELTPAGAVVVVTDSHDRYLLTTIAGDTVRTLATICERFRPGAVYNIAGESYHDIKTLSDMILERCGKTDSLVRYVQAEEHNTRDKKGSNERARRDLDHRETVSLADGLDRTIAWQRVFYGV